MGVKYNLYLEDITLNQINNDVNKSKLEHKENKKVYVRNKITYVINDNSAIVIGHKKGIINVVIPERIKVNGKLYNVTRIDDNAFSNCDTLVAISIPNSITSIGKYVFFCLESLIYNQLGNCSYLGNKTNPYLLLVETINTTIKDVIISNDTKFILDHAFSNCTNLTSVIIPNNIISIGSSAFDGCKSLKHINIPSSINILNNDTFFSCSSLELIVIPKLVTKIGKYVFRDCNSLTIFCEASSKPSGWNETWNYSDRPVYWVNEWSYVDGEPTPNIVQ